MSLQTRVASISAVLGMSALAYSFGYDQGCSIAKQECYAMQGERLAYSTLNLDGTVTCTFVPNATYGKKTIKRSAA